MSYDGNIGERVVPDLYKNDLEQYLIYLLHARTYEIILEHTLNKKVLDFGCGVGYGASLMATRAKQVVAIDISKEGIDYAKGNCQLPNVHFQIIEPTDHTPLPFPEKTFDIVVSFQVIEHVDNVPNYLKEISRVLTPGGKFIASTPNGKFRLLPFQRPWNLYHHREYDYHSLEKTLCSEFSRATIKGITFSNNWKEIERKRNSRSKWLLFPFTNILIPEAFRKSSLSLIKKIRLKYPPPQTLSNSEIPQKEDIFIADDGLDDCPSFLVICEK